MLKIIEFCGCFFFHGGKFVINCQPIVGQAMWICSQERHRRSWKTPPPFEVKKNVLKNKFKSILFLFFRGFFRGGSLVGGGRGRRRGLPRPGVGWGDL
jgi:hypothetical protein